MACRALKTHCRVIFFFLFFQAEDGIRDGTVTGVQTCALPISSSGRLPPRGRGLRKAAAASTGASALGAPQVARGRREQAAGRRQAAREHGTGVSAALVAKAVSFS